MRKIAVVTGTRAEYGLLYWILRGIQDDPELELQLIVTGMHLSPEFGLTVNQIETDGFFINEKVEMLLSADTETSISMSMGIGVMGFAKVYERLKPDVLLVLGDRFEILSAVVASIPFRIPVAHIHGGESTEGLIDEVIRHAVTKMSHMHFASTRKYARRIKQMGEAPQNVYCVGAPGLDNVQKLSLVKRNVLLDILEIPRNRQIGIVTFHPVTLENNTSEKQVVELLDSLRDFHDVFWVFTLPNADTAGRAITKKIKEYVNNNRNDSRVFESLGQLKYLSLMKHASLMVGNSSSGIVESPSFKLPVVNIGERQRGRIRAKNVIDVSECSKESIVPCIEKALSGKFKKSLVRLKNPYGQGNSSEKIVEILKSKRFNAGLIKKRFYDYP